MYVLLCRVLLALFAGLLVIGAMSHEVSARGGAGGNRGPGRAGGQGGNRSDSGRQTAAEVAKDLEERLLQEDREARILDARRVGAQSAYDAAMWKILTEEREKAAAERRRDWRGLANPG